MQDSPDGLTLLAQVEAALREGLAPGLPQRMAANAVGLARREAAFAGAAAEVERERLAQLLRRDGALAELNERLAAAIRTRAVTADTPGLVDHLWRTTIEKMRVDQPGYPAFSASGLGGNEDRA